jgi:hypothetical protein
MIKCHQLTIGEDDFIFPCAPAHLHDPQLQ